MNVNIEPNLRDKLFPNGIPEPDEFIRVIADYVRENYPTAANLSEPSEEPSD